MAVRSFNGTSDFIDCSAGSVAAGGGVTYAIVCKFLGGDANFCNLIHTADSSGNTQLGLERKDGGANANTPCWVLTDSAESDTTTLAVNVASGWVIIVGTKATGTSTPTYYVYSFSGASWSTANGANTLGDGSSVAGGTVNFGRKKGIDPDFANYEVAVAAVWNSVLTLGQAEALSTNKKTSDFWNNAGGHPVALWEFNQASTGTSVSDLSGNGANQSAISGTSVVTTDDPAGWTFDGTGSVAALNVYRIN